MTLHPYLPQDRLRALARGETLPDRTNGSALFADISGFTQLTEALRESLGSRQGAEKLTRHLDTVYTALIGEVEKYSGSVLGFAGDAITCWFDQRTVDDGQPSAVYAMACAFGLQKAMETFEAISLPNGKTASLSLKVSIATGDVRRLVVGGPKIHYIDTLAGATVARTSTAEHLANKGEILVDEATAQALDQALSIKEWRNAEREKFAVASTFDQQVSIANISAVPALEPEQYKAWIDQTVYERESSGQASFLTEFRPCAILFIKFAGIDYEADDAQTQLDAFIRQLQKTAARYEGAVFGKRRYPRGDDRLPLWTQ